MRQRAGNQAVVVRLGHGADGNIGAMVGMQIAQAVVFDEYQADGRIMMRK